MEEEDCKPLQEHYAQLQIAEEPLWATWSTEQKGAYLRTKQSVRKALPGVPRVLEECPRLLTKNQAKCALNAKTTEEWESCFQ